MKKSIIKYLTIFVIVIIIISFTRYNLDTEPFHINTINVHEFGDCIDMHFQNNNGGTQNNPYWNYITYTSTFKIINKNLKPVENENGQYETQISETFKLGQYQRSD